MKRIDVRIAAAVVLIASIMHTGVAQDETVTKIVLRDGSELIGTIDAENMDTVRFRTIGNVLMNIPSAQIKSKETLKGAIRDGAYVRPDPNHTRLFFAPTGRALGGGSGYLSASQLFFPFLAIGLTDFLAVGGGISLFPGAESQLVYLAPKVTALQMDQFSLSGGVLYITTTSAQGGGVGIMYGVSTFGSDKAALTLGLGWGFSESGTADRPLVMLGGELKVSNSVKLISENWIPPVTDLAFLSFGVRFFGDHLAADLGLMTITGVRWKGFPFFPWVGFAFNF